MREAVARAICRAAGTIILPECAECDANGNCTMIPQFLREADAAITEVRVHAQVFMRPPKKVKSKRR